MKDFEQLEKDVVELDATLLAPEPASDAPLAPSATQPRWRERSADHSLQTGSIREMGGVPVHYLARGNLSGRS
jgi:hypothetical protein